jgi:hypothetical protein
MPHTPQLRTPTPKRHCITIIEKNKVLKELETHETNGSKRGYQEQLANKYNVSPGQICDIKKNRDKIKDAMEHVGETSHRKQLNKLHGEFPKVDERLALWHEQHKDTMDISYYR